MFTRKSSARFGLWLLSLLVVFSLLCCGAALADSNGTTGALTWTLSDDGVLTVSGAGPMGENPTWDQSSIRRVVLQEGVTGISESAFARCGQLESVSLPSTLTNIASRAFLNCGKLTSVALPGGLQTVGYAAFAGTGLTEVVLPASVSSLNVTAFDDCASLTRVTVAEGNTAYASVDGLVYDAACEALILVPSGRAGVVTLPASVTTLFASPFASCSRLTGIAVADGNTAFSAEGGILYNAARTELIQVPRALSGAVTLAEGVPGISPSDFAGCAQITGITLPASVWYIGTEAFSGCSALHSLSLPASVSSLDPRFMSGSSLTSVNVAAGNPVYESRDSVIYTKGGAKLIACPPAKGGCLTIPSSVTTVGEYAFYRSHLALIIAPNTVSKIEAGAFASTSIGMLVLRNTDVEIVSQVAHREFPLLREEVGQAASGRLMGYTGSTAAAHAARYGIPFTEISVYGGQWIQTGSRWSYLTSDLDLATGWQQIGKTWYYFDGNGVMLTGWQQLDGTWYYLDASGAMVADGWHQISGAWYYFSHNGMMISDGWMRHGRDWYYLTASGAMATGWHQIGGAWYFFDGSGAMVTGWRGIGGTWYYFRSSGAMATGWLLLGRTWYYFDASGAMATGWREINGAWYYFDASGAMIANNWASIDGKWEYFSANGVWQPSGK